MNERIAPAGSRAALVAIAVLAAGFAPRAGAAETGYKNWMIGTWVTTTPQGCAPYYTFAPKSETHDFGGKPNTIDVEYNIHPDESWVIGNRGGRKFLQTGPNEMKAEGGCFYKRK